MWPRTKITPVEGVPEGVMFFMNQKHVNLQPIDTEVTFWNGKEWCPVAGLKPGDVILVGITEPEPDDPDTVMEFSLGDED